MNEHRSEASGKVTCDHAGTALRSWFDADAPLDRAVTEHATACFSCRRYRERLEELRGALGRLAVHAPSPGFAARVREAVATRDTMEPVRLPYTVAAVVALIFACAAFVGWFYPVRLDAFEGASWMRSTWRALESMNWFDVVRPMAALLERVSEIVETRLAGVYGLSPMALWATMGAVVVFLVVFNGFEARRDQLGRRWAKRG